MQLVLDIQRFQARSGITLVLLRECLFDVTVAPSCHTTLGPYELSTMTVNHIQDILHTITHIGSIATHDIIQYFDTFPTSTK